MEDLKEVVAYTDGGSHGNPGPGGYGVVLLYKGNRKEISEGYRLTTNNRMELMAAIAALKALKSRCKVVLYSDSKYLVDAMNLGWVDSWKKRGWQRAKNKKLLNVDLWKQLVSYCEKHDVTFVWVQGHSGVTENERCDQLTQLAIQKKPLKVDRVYEKEKNGL